MTSCLVIDSSFIYRLLLPSGEQPHYRQLFVQFQKQGLAFYAPTLWWYEVVSSLTKAVRFEQITKQRAEQVLAFLNVLDVTLVAPDPQMTQRAYDWTIQLKRAAAYDSFYVALAEWLQCDLWTADKKLVNAVGQPWVRYSGVA